MAIRESLLNTITSVASSDFVRLVTSAGESSKATVANLFKSFETGLGAKTSLTTSDYIRVVGSDNNLYKQSVSSVKSDMGVSALETDVNMLKNAQNGNALTSFDLNNLTETACYQFDKLTSAMTNAPNTGTYFSGFLFVERYASNKVLQTFYHAGGESAIYVRSLWNGTWGSWYKFIGQ